MAIIPFKLPLVKIERSGYNQKHIMSIHSSQFFAKFSRFFLLSFFSFLLFSQPVAAQQTWGKISATCTGAVGSDAADVATIQGVQCLVANVLNVILTIFSLVGFVMFVYGALIWLFSGSQTSNIEKARNTFTYAIFGLILALSSWVILQLIYQFTGLNGLLKIQFLGNNPPSTQIQEIGQDLTNSN